ncbi:MAG: sterol desaturase family protein [Ilumatobacteraceae bacterium]
MDFPPTRTPLLSYGLYPLIVGGATVAAFTAVRSGEAPTWAMPAILMPAIVVSMLVEWRHPLQERWRMTARTLWRRDLRFILLALAVDGLAETAVSAIANATVPDEGFGPIARLPIGLEVVVAILAFDLLWYWYHRLAHHRPRLWRVHGAHHTPPQMYVLMHGVFHPFDELMVRFVLALLVYRFGGFSPAATFVSLAIVGSIGIISHLNADVRLWAFNHLLIGPETHRIHHGTSLQSGNYGAATSLWDQLFGTFVFSFEPPAELGLGDPTTYPDPERFLAVLAWPLRR